MPTFPKLEKEFREERLRLPGAGARLPVVLDTDTFNEIDDQFALTYALMSPERIDLQAIHIAPFANERCPDVRDRIAMSEDEVHRILDAMDLPVEGRVYRGMPGYLDPVGGEQPTDASEDLIRRAMARPLDSPLVVVAIGAITNISNALLQEPELVRRIVVVWLGGHAFHWPDTNEFNLQQDVWATRVLLDSGVPLIHVPCWGVSSHLSVTYPELETHVAKQGKIGAYLTEIFRQAHPDYEEVSHVLWDVAPIVLLNCDSWTPSRIVPTPLLNDDLTWSHNADRHPMRYVFMTWRTEIIRDFMRKLKHFAGGARHS